MIGVPQGSVLGPILFLIFINDLPDNIKSSVRLFADDCVLYRNIHSLQDCLILQEDLDSLGLWEVDWHMKFNVAKCHSRERSGSVVECLTRDGRAAGSSLTGVTALWSLSKTHLS